jgi:hypothetical protein
MPGFHLPAPPHPPGLGDDAGIGFHLPAPARPPGGMGDAAAAGGDPGMLPPQTPAEQLKDAETALAWLQREQRQQREDRMTQNAIEDQNKMATDLRGRIRKEADEALGRGRFGGGGENDWPGDGNEPVRALEARQEQDSRLGQVIASCDAISQRLDACDQMMAGFGAQNPNVMTR